MPPPPPHGSPLTSQEAIRLADWYVRYALDLVQNEPCHPGVFSHTTAASVQLVAITRLLDA